MSHFEQEDMGRGPKDIRTHLIGDVLVVRLRGVLTAAEQNLVKTLPTEKGRDLLKQVRSQLIEVARPALTSALSPAKRSWSLRWPRRLVIAKARRSSHSFL
jgi:uncharacterized protein YbcI